jgi:hypothetical protein
VKSAGTPHIGNHARLLMITRTTGKAPPLVMCCGPTPGSYNGHRPHQSRQQRPPDIETQPARDIADLRSARRKPVVAGLINEYHCAT